VGKRYTFLAGMISLLTTTLAWQFMDEGWIPSASFTEKLLVAFVVVLVTYFATTILLGRKQEGIKL